MRTATMIEIIVCWFSVNENQSCDMSTYANFVNRTINVIRLYGLVTNIIFTSLSGDVEIKFLVLNIEYC